MAYSQLGYSYSPPFLMTSSSLAGAPGSNPALRSTAHQLSPGGGFGVYSGPYPKGQSYYNSCSSDAAALYPRTALEPKEAASHVGTSQTAAYYPYEYTFGQYPYDRYGYPCSDSSSRRKNATRETTSTLKAWLQEHQKNPYPTKGEKIMLAIITRMTLTQVSTWFANARRRLKKENKVTWSPRACKGSDERGCEEDEGEVEKPRQSDSSLPAQQCAELQSDLEDFDLLESDVSDSEPKQPFPAQDTESSGGTDVPHVRLSCHAGLVHGKESASAGCLKSTPVHPQSSSFYISPDPKPKIWCIADTAAPLEGSSQPVFPACMMSSTRSSSPVYPGNMALTKSSRQQESPVATLREWVDGVFHGPTFQPKPAEAWKGLSGALTDGRTHAQPFELAQSAPSL